LKKKFKNKFSDEEISGSLNRIICEAIQLDTVKQTVTRKERKKKSSHKSDENTETQVEKTEPVAETTNTENIAN